MCHCISDFVFTILSPTLETDTGCLCAFLVGIDLRMISDRAIYKHTNFSISISTERCFNSTLDLSKLVTWCYPYQLIMYGTYLNRSLCTITKCKIGRDGFSTTENVAQTNTTVLCIRIRCLYTMTHTNAIHLPIQPDCFQHWPWSRTNPYLSPSNGV